MNLVTDNCLFPAETDEIWGVFFGEDFCGLWEKVHQDSCSWMSGSVASLEHQRLTGNDDRARPFPEESEGSGSENVL